MQMQIRRDVGGWQYLARPGALRRVLRPRTSCRAGQSGPWKTDTRKCRGAHQGMAETTGRGGSMTLEELRELADKERARHEQFKHRILYCSAAGCVSCGSTAVRDTLKAALKENGLENEVEVL